MKKLFSSLIVLVVLLSLCQNVFAASPGRLVDGADLLTPVEEAYLVNRLDEISDQYDLDVVIVTVSTLDGASAQAYADDYYDYNGYRPDGILLLISIYDRYWAISTTGYGITAFTDAGLAYMEDQFLNDLSEGNYSDAFLTFSAVSEELLIQAQSGRPYDIGNLPKVPFDIVQSLLVSLVIGLVCALIITFIMRAQLKSVRSQAAASQYVRSGSMELTHSRDLYLYRRVDRQRRQTNQSRSGHSGSSVHRSSSGRSHGGRSGRF